MGPIPELREGDVVEYDPPQHHCSDRHAIAKRRADGSLVLVDTYWIADGTVVTPESYEVLYNLGDYQKVARTEWERYAPADRRVLHRQHGYYRDCLVRKGAAESRDQIVANAREALAEAEGEVESAVRRRDWRQRELDELLASGGAS